MRHKRFYEHSFAPPARIERAANGLGMGDFAPKVGPSGSVTSPLGQAEEADGGEASRALGDSRAHLAKAIEHAASAGQWDLVTRLVSLLESKQGE